MEPLKDSKNLSTISIEQNIWKCPICQASHTYPVIQCRRCKSPILLLLKAYRESAQKKI
jgi:hypothetical protein